MSNGNVFTSPSGNFTLSIDDSGIVLSGPSGGVTVNASGVTINGSLIQLNGANAPIARVGDTLSTGGVITGPGNPTVLA
jgi:hypothetical protein